MREILALIVTLIVAYVVYALVFANGDDAPDAASSGPPPPDTVLPDTVRLGIGEEARLIVGGASYRIGVSAVSDSRCAGCPDPGRATAVITTRHAGGRKQTHRIATDAPQGLVSGPVVLRVVGVSPDAAAVDEKIGKRDYRVSVEVDRVQSSEAPADSIAATGS